MILFLTSLALAGEFQIGKQTVVHQALPNGLDMLWIDDGQPLIDIYVVYAAGKSMENQPSLAHMTEHAMFCAKDGAFDTILKPHVKATNAYTRNEHTTYYSTDVSVQSLPIVLSQEYQRMDGIDADQACFDYEKGRLEKEEKENFNLIADWEDKRNGLLFGSGYGGKPTVKNDLTLADIQNFYDLWYQPKRASMVIVGSIDQRTWEELQAIFSKLQNREEPRITLSDVEPNQANFDYPLSKERRDWLWRGPSIDDRSEWLYWTVAAKAYLLERDNDGLDLSFDTGMMASFIEMSATGENGAARLADFHKRVEKGEIGAKAFQDAKDSFARHLQELPIRGRPYFSVASYLGFWAAWDRVPTLLQMLEDVQNLSATPSKKALSYISKSQKSEVYNPKGEVGELPDDPKKLSVAAELAQNSGDISRAIACYKRLLELKPNKINAVIYHYYLGHLYLESGDKEQAKKSLLDGLAIVEYPALRELLEEIDQDAPHERGEAAVVSSNTDRLAFEGETPQWAQKAADVMVKLEEWRGLSFKNKVTIRFQQDAGYDAAGWYDHETKTLVVGKGGSERFGEGVMLHELYHALQDQQFDLSKIEKRLQSEDHRRAFHAVVEGEAML
ncbi:MAG: insulinase family protein, partial [Myxococcota bacterium]|nr:insulinase family protein [Myxococcota bacterium]